MNALVTFHSVSMALFAKATLAKEAAACNVVPVPRSVSSSCGYALETSALSAPSLAAMMDAAHVEWDAVYHLVPEDSGERYELLMKRENGT